MSVTASTIIGNARDLLKAESGSDVPVIGDAFMLTAISDGNLKWADAFRSDGEEPIVFQRETGFDLVAETAINDASGTTTASTSITVDAQTFPDSAGAAVIWDDNMPDLFAYTSQTSTLFSGVTGLGFAHEDNDVIQPLYKLPATFGTLRESPEYGDGVQLNGNPLFFTGGVPPSGYFSIYDDGTRIFLWLPRGTRVSAWVCFNKNSTTIDSTDDTVDVPETYKMFLVWHCIMYATFGRDQNANMYQFAQIESEKILQRALSRRNEGKKIRPRSFGRIYRDYTTINGTRVSL